jgi:hypothetical protein
MALSCFGTKVGVTSNYVSLHVVVDKRIPGASTVYNTIVNSLIDFAGSSKTIASKIFYQSTARYFSTVAAGLSL